MPFSISPSFPVLIQHLITIKKHAPTMQNTSPIYPAASRPLPAGRQNQDFTLLHQHPIESAMGSKRIGRCNGITGANGINICLPTHGGDDIRQHTPSGIRQVGFVKN
jgi:hypothetical protein